MPHREDIKWVVYDRKNKAYLTSYRDPECRPSYYCTGIDLYAANLFDTKEEALLAILAYCSEYNPENPYPIKVCIKTSISRVS